MKKHLKIIKCYFKLNLASALEYRASFISQAFGMALSNSAFIFFWWIAFDQIGGHIAGYSFEDVLFIWAVTSSAFGLAHVLFHNVSRLPELIVTGELDVFLLQPCNILVNVLCARTSLSAYGDFAYGFILLALSQGRDGQAWLWFLIAVAIGSLLMTAISLFARSLTFYWGNTSIIGVMCDEFLINFSIYPEKIYAAPVRVLMYTLLPAAFVVHVPLRLARGFSPGWAALMMIAVAVYGILAAAFFYRGLRRYESGNAIVTRM